eukprot:s826_g2.t3
MTSEIRGRRLPIVIVPGFCSSRLEVAQSDVDPSWKGYKVWLGLTSIGFTAMHSKGTFDDPETKKLKNKWLQHLVLSDAEHEAAGVHLTVVPGISGVDYLDPDSFFGLAAEASYVFAPVVRMLEKLGYKEGVDLIAAPYDWRFAPSVMEKREGYFQRLLASIETLDKDGTGVILLAHSMGNKVVSYFLDFAVKQKGQAWVDKHVHLWLAAGAPHLGAPQAVRSTVFGDNFGLDAFITDSEARAFARSLSASPWLFPQGEMAKKPMFHLRRGGALELTSVSAMVPNSGIASAENKVLVTFEISWGDGQSENLTTKSASAFDGSLANFDEADNFLQFGGPPELPTTATIRAILKEKGYHDASTSDVFTRLGHAVKAGVMLVGEAAAGRGGLGVPRAQTEAASLAQALQGPPDGQGFVEVRLPFAKDAGPMAVFGYGSSKATSDFISFRARWLDYAKLKAEWIGKLNVAPAETESPFRHGSRPGVAYEPLEIRGLLSIEKCEGIQKTLETHYRDDSLYDFRGDRTSIPIKRLLAVHGVNMPTEEAYAVRVATVRLKRSKVLTRLAFDGEAVLKVTDREESPEGVKLESGLVKACGSDVSPSGDGVVPLASLDQCRSWVRRDTEYSLVYLPGVEHRGMLASEHFHQVIREAAIVDTRTPQEPPKMRLSIAGTFTAWKPEVMRWDGHDFVYVVMIGAQGWESFQLLQNGSWDTVFYPSIKEAGMDSEHTICGPDRKNAGFDWTLGQNRGQLRGGSLPPGAAYTVRAIVDSSGAVRSVGWAPFALAEDLQASLCPQKWQASELDGGRWFDFPADVSAKLGAELALLHTAPTVVMGGQEYRIDFLNMLQTNLKTRTQRRIRRVPAK